MRDAPPFLFCLAKREMGRAKRKERFLSRSGTFVPPRYYGGRRIGASADFGPPSGTLGPSAIFLTTVPWRMVRKSSGCKNAFDQLLFPRVPLARKGHAASVSGKAANGCAVATRCPGGRRGRCSYRPVAEAFINHRASGSEKRSRMYPRLPRAKDFPKGRAFPSLTAARDRQPSPAGGRRSARAQTDPPNIFSFPPGAAHFLFDVSIWGPRRAPRGGERRSKGAGAVFAAGGNGA